MIKFNFLKRNKFLIIVALLLSIQIANIAKADVTISGPYQPFGFDMPYFLSSSQNLFTVTSTGSLVQLNLNSPSASINRLDNDGVINGIIMSSNSIGNIDNNSSIGSISMYGSANIGTISNNSGASFGDINLNIISRITTINNAANANMAGVILNGNIDSNPIFSTRSSIDTINNLGNIDFFGLSYSDIDTIDSSGTISDNITLSNDARINDLVNSGNINGNVDIDSTSSIGSIVNSGHIESINNSGDINDINISSGGLLSSLTNNGSINSISATSSSISNINNAGTINGDIELTSSTIGTINNSGTIHGSILINGTDAANIINSGLISGNLLLQQPSNGSILTLNPGSKINGTIFFSSNIANTVNIGGGSQETRTYNYSGDFTLAPYNQNLLLVTRTSNNFTVTNKTTIQDVTTPNSLRSSINIENMFLSRLNNFRRDNKFKDEVQIALNENKKITSDASNSNLGIKFDHKASFWSEVFGSYNERSSYKASGDLESTSGGILFGVDKVISANKRLGGFVGGLNGKTDINGGLDNKVLRNVDSKGLFAGGYLSNNYRPYFMDLALIVGVLENDSSRLVNSNEIARSEFNNVFLTPSVTIGKKLNSIPAIASFTLRNTGQWVETVRETGSSSNIKTNGRYINILSSRLQLETANKSKELSDGIFNFNVRAGLEGNRLIGSQNIDITISSQNISITSLDRKYNIDGFVGFNTSYDLKDDVRIYADVEASRGISKAVSNNDIGLYGKLGLRWGF